jgi:hypothetical protein
MRALLPIAILLIVIYVIARLTAFAAGAMLNLIWIIALILLAVWLFNFVTGRNRTRV